MTTIISFQKVYKQFDENRVLENFNLDIHEGETLTIIGGSGSGKSVALKILLGLMQPDSGKVFFHGCSIQEMSHEEIIEMRRQVGMLFQGAALFDSLSVFENVAYPLREHFRYSDEKIGRIVTETLGLVGLPGTERLKPADLSGGMKKRVALARAISTSPSVLLYDEPTTGLDPSNAMRINRLIVELQKKLGVTSVAVTHDMDSAFMISDRLAMLYDRHIVFTGTPEEGKRPDNKVVRDFIHGTPGNGEET